MPATSASSTSIVQQLWRGSDGFDIATCGAGIGLFLLALSPFFKWINFGNGGVMGLSGDGKIVLGVTVLAIAACITAIAKGKWLVPVLLGVQAWGTLAVFWMGSLIWKVGSILTSSPDIKDNPFAGLIAALQISPGAGLYLGLIGGIAVAGALGFIAVRRLLASGSLKPYYATQGISCALGILLACLVGPDRPSTRDSTTEVGASSVSGLGISSGAEGDISPFESQGTSPEVAQAEWKKTHDVSDEQWQQLITNFTARKHLGDRYET